MSICECHSIKSSGVHISPPSYFFFLLPKEKGEHEESLDNKDNHWKHEQSDSYCEE
jgi:hypothetical protein